MTKIISVFIFSFIFLLSCSNKNELVVLSDHSFPPFEYIKDGIPSGIDPDIATVIAQKLNKKIKIFSVGFTSIIPSIERKMGDIGIAAITITPDRQERVAFSIPYAKSEQFIISLKDFPVINKNELEGLKIGVKQGTSAHTLIQQMGLKRINLLPYPTTLHTIRALLNNETEAVVIDQQTALWATKQYPQLQSHPLKDSTEYYGICVHKSNYKLLTEINTIIKEMTANGEIDALIEKHSNLF